MACFRPLHAFKVKRRDGGIGKYDIVWKRVSDCIPVDLPCGQCSGCRLERSRQWAVRCMHEASLYDRNIFVTLTYSDDFLPYDGSLVKRDFVLFLKKLRFQFGEGIRFYMCGEYGENFGRPHYHAILFNFDFDDKVLFTVRNDCKYYTSVTLDSIWSKGQCLISDVTFNSAAYVARYVMKKVTGDPDMVDNHYQGRIPEYNNMSRGSKKLGTGGIGKGWFEKYKGDVYPSDEVIVNGKSTRPPRFYDNLLDSSDPDMLASLKIKRRLEAPEWIDNDGKRLLVKEEVKLSHISTLKRVLD